MKIAFLTTDSREHFGTYEKPEPYFGSAPEALLQGFAGLPGAKVWVISCARRHMQSPDKLAPNIHYRSLYVGKLGWMRTLFQGCVRAVRRELQAIQPDIVHGQGTERDCAISAVLSGYPNVLTLHGNMRLIAQVTKARAFSHPWLAARLEKFLLPRTRGVVCITRYTRDAVADLAKRLWVVPNAVDGSFFELVPQPEPGTVPRILCVGHVGVRKNQNAFIHALDPLAQKQKFEVVFLGGTTPGRAYDEEFLALVKARTWCQHAGYADRETVRKWFQSGTLLALPSLEDNCPMVVLEAMAARVPVVAAEVGGVPDLVEPGQTGLFCDPYDAQSMRDAVARVLNDAALARSLADTAKLRALERFHPRVIAQKHLEIYREVLGRQD